MRMGANAFTGLWHGLDTSWMDSAACAGLSVEERRCFFGDTRKGVRGELLVLEAKQFCWDCPVQAECLSYAIESKLQGIWGGTTGKERADIARAARRRSA